MVRSSASHQPESIAIGNSHVKEHLSSANRLRLLFSPIYIDVKMRHHAISVVVLLLLIALPQSISASSGVVERASPPIDDDPTVDAAHDSAVFSRGRSLLEIDVAPEWVIGPSVVGVCFFMTLVCIVLGDWSMVPGGGRGQRAPHNTNPFHATGSNGPTTEAV